jgi:hypothetical protein
MYRRDSKLKFVKKLIEHYKDIEDCDISINDEYLITASKDRSVGLVNLG